MTKAEKEVFMKIALLEAEKAAEKGEVPVGAVIVKDGEIIAYGHNCRETLRNSIYHAEIMAINEACLSLDSWRLENCDLYVTLEPCPMCMGAVISSRVENLYFGAYDEKAGACGSVLALNDYPLNHKVKVEAGILREQSQDLLTGFFEKLRKKSSS